VKIHDRSVGDAVPNAAVIAGNAMLTIVTSRKARNAASDETANTSPARWVLTRNAA
jgi:hypothetical protein